MCANNRRESLVYSSSESIARERGVMRRRVEQGTIKNGPRIEHFMAAHFDNPTAVQQHEAVYPRERTGAMRDEDQSLPLTELGDRRQYCGFCRRIECWFLFRTVD